MAFDAALFRKALGVGVDRMWCSYGTVAEDSPDAHSVRFKDDKDVAIPEGPLVTVVLHPSEIVVVCRVAGASAGIGEGEWCPMLQGDEVVVLIPEGDTHAGCVIVGRCNNGIDTFPLVVGGQDASKNTFGFKRSRTPFILETAASYLVRSAVTGAQFGIDQTGQFIMNDGDGSSFFFGADALGMATSDGSTSIQLLVGDKQIAMTAGSTASFLLDASASQFTSSGMLSIAPGGILAMQHAVSVEQVLTILDAFLTILGTTFPGPLVGVTVAGAKLALINGALAGFAGSPVTPYVPALTAALSIPPDPTGIIAGVGRVNFLM